MLFGSRIPAALAGLRVPHRSTSGSQVGGGAVPLAKTAAEQQAGEAGTARGWLCLAAQKWGREVAEPWPRMAGVSSIPMFSASR